jgi:hypothetical protein
MLLKVVSKPMIDTGDLNSALQTAKPLFNELQNQYENLPAHPVPVSKTGGLLRVSAPDDPDGSPAMGRHPPTAAGFEETYHSDFSFWMTTLVLGVRKSVLVKFAVIKEMVNQGSSKRLEGLLDKVTPEVLELP